MTTSTLVLLALGALFLLGMPIFMSLAIASAVGLVFGNALPMSIIHNSIFDGLNLFPLLAIPCFIIAGVIIIALVVTWFQLAVVVQSTILWIGWPILGIITILQTLGMVVKVLRRYRGYKV
ncbi:MAG: TRAP transporter large permease subunit, partial [Gammaproteobacteria bacterium]|nr:TRAP transporter large permease subunit [Gammaproteobacteria bacterium]